MFMKRYKEDYVSIALYGIVQICLLPAGIVRFEAPTVMSRYINYRYILLHQIEFVKQNTFAYLQALVPVHVFFPARLSFNKYRTLF